MTPQVIGERFLQGTPFRELVGHVLGATEEEREQTMERMLREWAGALSLRAGDYSDVDPQAAYERGWNEGYAEGKEDGEAFMGKRIIAVINGQDESG